MIGLVKIRLQTTPYEVVGNNPTLGFWIKIIQRRIWNIGTYFFCEL